MSRAPGGTVLVLYQKLTNEMRDTVPGEDIMLSSGRASTVLVSSASP